MPQKSISLSCHSTELFQVSREGDPLFRGVGRGTALLPEVTHRPWLEAVLFSVDEFQSCPLLSVRAWRWCWAWLTPLPPTYLCWEHILCPNQAAGETEIMSLLSVQRKEMSFGGQLIVSAVQSFCRFLKFFNFFKPLPMLDPLFPDSYSFLPFLDLVSCFDGWSMSSSIFLRKSVLKLKILRCFIPENVFILFYTWWIIFPGCRILVGCH